MTDERTRTVTDWDYIDSIEEKLGSIGAVNVSTERIGAEDVVTDFYEPGRTLRTTQRGVGSSLRLKNPREFSQLTHRMPTWMPEDGDVSRGFEVARQMANSVMRVDNRRREGAEMVSYRGTVPTLGTPALLTFEPRPAVSDSVNIHVVIQRGGFPPGTEVDALDVLDLAAALTDAFYDAI